MKNRMKAFFMALVMGVTFATSLLGNGIEAKAEGIKIAKAIYDGTQLKVTMAGSLQDGSNAFTIVSQDEKEVMYPVLPN